MTDFESVLLLSGQCIQFYEVECGAVIDISQSYLKSFRVLDYIYERYIALSV